MLLFQLGGERYAMDARAVVEIVPLVDFTAVPKAPDYVSGLFNYHDTAVPVLDLCRLLHESPSRPYLSSRIILIDYGRVCGSPPGGPTRILGLLAESVTDVREQAQAAVPSPVDVPNAPFLGGVFFHDGEINQCLKPAALLPESLRETLFAAATQTRQEDGAAV